MSKILEALIARGRRARNPREQKGVASGLAEQSTQKELHERFYKKGGISTLLTLLRTSTDFEAQRLSALAIANCVSAPQCYRSVIQQEDTLLITLTEYVKDAEKDPQGRNYCAMAIGNLAVEAGNHEDIVNLGAIEAIIQLLHSYPNNGEAGRFGAFALSNLAGNEKFHRKMVDNGAIEILVALACTDNQRTQHWALAALRGICSSPQYRVIAVRQGILDPLVLMTRSEQVEILREVSAAFNCLSSAKENKLEMVDKALSTVMALLLTGDMEVERHACSAIANLIEMPDAHARFIEERGLPPVVALAVSSTDEKCKGEAARVIANLSANVSIQQELIREGIVEPMVGALLCSDLNCKRFAALSIANIAMSTQAPVKFAQSRAVQTLVKIIKESDSRVEVKRYAALAIANLSGTIDNHQWLFEEEGMLSALCSLTNVTDPLSQYYVSCALANFTSSILNHEFFASKGGLQSAIALAHSKDLNTQRQAAAALRGLSATSGIDTKIVQEGGLEPLVNILTSQVHNETLQEVTACLCNICLSDENKFKIVKSGAVAALIECMQSEDILVSVQSIACLASLAEIQENHDFLFNEGCIPPCVEIMRSRRQIEAQKESGRLLANMCAGTTAEITDLIVKEGGHQMLISFLSSQDIMCQRIGTLGTSNLCTQEPYRTLLALCGAIEPLCFVARSEATDMDVRLFALLAIANLALPEENHELFIKKGVLNMLVSLCNLSDGNMRNYAAYAVANLARNADIRDEVIKEGGIDSVLFLARNLEPEMQHVAVAAIANLSFSTEHKKYIFDNGGLCTISAALVSDNPHQSILSCCALANLSEDPENLDLMLGSGMIELCFKLLQINSSPDVLSESFRALGNISANTENGEMVVNNDSILKSILLVVREGHVHVESRRMAVMAVSNLAANLTNHSKLLRNHAAEPLIADFRAALDEKGLYDNETVQFGLLIISNLAASRMSHTLIVNLFLDSLVRFTRHRDIKCRQYSVLAIGNLCSNADICDRMVDIGCMNILISYSFPSTSDFSLAVRTQAVAGLRGLATHAVYRMLIIQNSGLEPLILAMASSNCRNIICLQREAVATLRNLALGEESGFLMIQNGVLPTLIEISMSDDDECQYQALLSLASLAELESRSQSSMLEAGCLRPLLRVADSRDSTEAVREAAVRCICLFSCSVDSHSFLLRSSIAQRIGGLIRRNDDVVCQRYVSLAVANFAVPHTNHQVLLDSAAVAVVLNLASSCDTETRRAVSFMLHGLSSNSATHTDCTKLDVPKIVATLLTYNDLETQIQACLCIRHLCVYHEARVRFIEAHGLPPLFALSKSESIELKREVAAALRNISICDQGKLLIAEDGGIQILTELSRIEDHEVSHQSCGVLANLAEAPQNQENMVNIGILQHLKYVWRCSSIDIRREVLRAIANISSNKTLNNELIGAGVVAIYLVAFTLPDMLCKRFALMGIANLATNVDIHGLLASENILNHIFSIAKQNEQENHHEALRCAICALTNFTTLEKNHLQLKEFGTIKVAVDLLKHSDRDVRNSAMLCLANLASNSANHDALSIDLPMDHFEGFLHCSDRQFLFRTLQVLKGLSVDPKMQHLMTSFQVLSYLMKLALSNFGEVQREAVGVLCNLSICGCFHELSHLVLQEFSVSIFISFLQNSDQIFQLFAALVLGNVASEEKLHDALLQSSVLVAIVSAFKIANFETQRLLSRALCNLAATDSARLSILQLEGLLPIISLSESANKEDMRVGLSVLRGFSAYPDSRRILVEAGALKVISQGIKSEKPCQQEAVACLSALSLNDENKRDIMTGILEDTLELSSIEDQRCLEDVAEIFANLSEDENLHLNITHFIEDNYIFDRLLQNGNTELRREVARFIANLASTRSSHTFLIKSGILPYFAHLCGLQDALCRRYSVIGLFNLALEVKNNQLFTHSNDVVSPLATVIRDSIHYDPLSCRYAILALGALATSFEFHEIIMYSSRNVSLIGELIDAGDPEMSMYCCFALNKLSSNEQMMMMMDSCLIGALITSIDASDDRHICTQCVSALRKLCLKPINRWALVEKSGLTALNDLSCLADPDILREIASCFLYISFTKDLVSILVDGHVFHSIRLMLMLPDIETLRMALGTLANMAEDCSAKESLIVESKIFPTLCSLIKHSSLSVQREASRAVANFLSFEYVHGMLKLQNGIAKLSFLAKSTDNECTSNVSLCFRKLASNFSNHDDLMSEKYFQTLLELTTCSFIEAKRMAAAALLNLSHNEIHKCTVAQKGGLIAATKLLSDGDYIVRNCAVQIIYQFSVSKRMKTIMVQDGVTDKILQYLRKTDEVDVLQQYIAVLVNLSGHSENQCKLVQMGLLSSLIDLSYHGDVHIRNDVASIFCYLSSQLKHRDGVFGEQHFKAMIHLLSFANEECSRITALTLGNLAESKENIKMIVSLNGLLPLAALLENDVPDKCRSASSRVIRKIALLDECISCIVEVDLITKLLDNIQHPSVEVQVEASMALCNLANLPDAHDVMIKADGIQLLVDMLSNPDKRCRKFSAMGLCNYSKLPTCQIEIVKLGGVSPLINCAKSDDKKCVTYATLALCNLSANRENRSFLVGESILDLLLELFNGYADIEVHRALAALIYNLSLSVICHEGIVKASVLDVVHVLCKASDIICKRYALMAMCNLSSNSVFRKPVTGSGGLNSAIILVESDDIDMKLYACACLTNMSNNSVTQNMIVVHGGLPSLMKLANSTAAELQRSAIFCLGNIAANESNHSAMVHHGTLELLVKMTSSPLISVRKASSLALTNFAANKTVLSVIGKEGGIRPLLSLMSSGNMYDRYLASSAIRCLSCEQKNWETLCQTDALNSLALCGKSDEIEIKRSVAASFCNLSLGEANRVIITTQCLKEVVALSQVDDDECRRQSIGAVANLAESIDTHELMKGFIDAESLLGLLHPQNLTVSREISRLLSNFLMSNIFQDSFAEVNELALVFDLVSSEDPECLYHVSVCLRTLSLNPLFHKMIVNSGLISLFTLIKGRDFKTKKHAAAALRDLCASEMFKEQIASQGGIDMAVLLTKSSKNELQVLGLASLRHLALTGNLKRIIVSKGALEPCMSYASWAADGLQRQIAGLLANLSEDVDNQVDMVVRGVVQSVLSLTRNKNSEIHQDCSRILANLAANHQNQVSVYRHGALDCLISLANNTSDDICQRYIAIGIQFLVSNPDVRRNILAGHTFLSFCDMASSDIVDYKRTVAASFASLSLEASSRATLAKTFGIEEIIRLCGIDDPQTKRDAVFTTANLSEAREIQDAIVKQGGIKALYLASCTSCDINIQRDVTRAYSCLVHSPVAQQEMLQNNILQSLYSFSQNSDKLTQRFAALTLCNMSFSSSNVQLVVSGVITPLLFFARFPDLEINRCAALSIAGLALGSLENKLLLLKGGALTALLSMIKFPDEQLQSCCLLGLNCVALGKSDEVKIQLVKEEAVDLLLSLLKKSGADGILGCLYLLGSMAENDEVRALLVGKGCVLTVAKKVKTDNIDIKRAAAYFLALFAEQKDYHKELETCGALEAIVTVTSTPDGECQEYGSFALVHLSGNPDHQLQLARMGAVRLCVSLLATNSESKQYAAFALLKLAGNFENHLIIAEQGGIQALLRLGRSQFVNEEVHYQAAMAVGNLASNAMKSLGKNTVGP